MTTRFMVPPTWPAAPQGWVPPEGWQAPAEWGPAPAGWQFWYEDGAGVPALRDGGFAASSGNWGQDGGFAASSGNWGQDGGLASSGIPGQDGGFGVAPETGGGPSAIWALIPEPRWRWLRPRHLALHRCFARGGGG